MNSFNLSEWELCCFSHDHLKTNYFDFDTRGESPIKYTKFRPISFKNRHYINK